MAKRRNKNTISHISSVLYKYGSKKYRTDSKARNKKAKAIQGKFKKKKKQPSINDIVSRSRGKKRAKRKLELPFQLAQPSIYFEAVDYPRFVLLARSGITFISKISREGVPNFKGGDKIDYYTYFSDFVNFCNAMSSQSKFSQGETDEIPWYIKCTQPDSKGISKIIQCNGDGSPANFGFDPKNVEKKPTEEQIPKREEKKEEPKPEAPKPTTPSAETPTEAVKRLEKEIELEKRKEMSAEAQRRMLAERIEYIKELKSQGFSNAEIMKIIGE